MNFSIEGRVVRQRYGGEVGGEKAPGGQYCGTGKRSRSYNDKIPRHTLPIDGIGPRLLRQRPAALLPADRGLYHSHGEPSMNTCCFRDWYDW